MTVADNNLPKKSLYNIKKKKDLSKTNSLNHSLKLYLF